MTRAAAFLAGLIAAACPGPAPLRGQEEPVSYFPTTVGTRLMYQSRHAGKDESDEVVQVVTKVEAGPAGRGG